MTSKQYCVKPSTEEWGQLQGCNLVCQNDSVLNQNQYQDQRNVNEGNQNRQGNNNQGQNRPKYNRVSLQNTIITARTIMPKEETTKGIVTATVRIKIITMGHNNLDPSKTSIHLYPILSKFWTHRRWWFMTILCRNTILGCRTIISSFLCTSANQYKTADQFIP